MPTSRSPATRPSAVFSIRINGLGYEHVTICPIKRGTDKCHLKVLVFDLVLIDPLVFLFIRYGANIKHGAKARRKDTMWNRATLRAFPCAASRLSLSQNGKSHG